MFFALKEIRRSLGRFALLTTAVGLLVLLLLFFQAVAGTLTLGITGAVQSSAADVFVYDARARLNPQASILPPQAVQQVTMVDGVAAAAPIGIGVFTATATTDDTATTQAAVDVTVFGGDPTGPSVPRTLSAGRLPRAEGEAIFSGSSLDSSFALSDQIAVGPQVLTVVSVADDAAFNVAPTFYVPFDTYAGMVQERAGSDIDVPLSLVGVALDEDAGAQQVAAAITDSVAGVQAVDRGTAVTELPGAGQITQSFGILYLLLFVVVTIVTGVFFLILTVQKSDALVLLRAVDASRADVVRPVLIQVVIIVGLGAIRRVLNVDPVPATTKAGI
ncbi:hypothetical protein BH24ACT15_BH24ACT15_11910 [soil metagenome]